MNLKLVFFLVLIFIFNSCDNVQLPKPKAFLSLDYPLPKYKEVRVGDNVLLKINGSKTFQKDLMKSNSRLSKKITYNLIKADLKLDYYSLNDENNIKDRLKSLEHITSIHLKKSSQPPKVQEYINLHKNVYASIININGDVISPYQFYATDSLNHLLIGILNLKSKTKYDSVLPALDYIKKDIYHLIESIKWSDIK
jgi:gliding motility-associated lipoprotein GldD